jgi:hypothetical protein
VCSNRRRNDGLEFVGPVPVEHLGIGAGAGCEEELRDAGVIAFRLPCADP